MDKGMNWSPEDLEEEYREFLQSLGPEPTTALPEEDDSDPDFIDDLQNMVQSMREQGILAGGSGGLENNLDNGKLEGSQPAVTNTTPPAASNSLNFVDMQLHPCFQNIPDLQTDTELDPLSGIGDDLPDQPDFVCNRTRARHPLTDVDITDLETNLCEDSECNWPRTDELGPFDFDALLNSPGLPFEQDRDNFWNHTGDLDDPEFLEALKDVLEDDAFPQTNHPPATLNKDSEEAELARPQPQPPVQVSQAVDTVACAQPVQTPPSPREASPIQKRPLQGGIESAPPPPLPPKTIFVNTPAASVPMESDTWNRRMIVELHTLLQGHTKMLLQAFGLSTPHNHLREAASEVRSMLNSLRQLCKTQKSAQRQYQRMAWKSLQSPTRPGAMTRNKKCASTKRAVNDNSETQTEVGVIHLTDRMGTEVVGSIRGSTRHGQQINEGWRDKADNGHQASSEEPSTNSTVVDIPVLRVLPDFFETVCALESRFGFLMNEAEQRTIDIAMRTSKHKGFVPSVALTEMMDKVYRPLQVFYPDICMVDSSAEGKASRGGFWSSTETKLLKLGGEIHGTDWVSIKSNYLPAKQLKDIESRTKYLYRKHKRLKVPLHRAMEGVKVSILEPSQQVISECREQLKRVCWPKSLQEEIQDAADDGTQEGLDDMGAIETPDTGATQQIQASGAVEHTTVGSDEGSMGCPPEGSPLTDHSDNAAGSALAVTETGAERQASSALASPQPPQNAELQSVPQPGSSAPTQPPVEQQVSNSVAQQLVSELANCSRQLALQNQLLAMQMNATQTSPDLARLCQALMLNQQNGQLGSSLHTVVGQIAQRASQPLPQVLQMVGGAPLISAGSTQGDAANRILAAVWNLLVVALQAGGDSSGVLGGQSIIDSANMQFLNGALLGHKLPGSLNKLLLGQVGALQQIGTALSTNPLSFFNAAASRSGLVERGLGSHLEDLNRADPAGPLNHAQCKISSTTGVGSAAVNHFGQSRGRTSGAGGVHCGGAGELASAGQVMDDQISSGNRQAHLGQNQIQQQGGSVRKRGTPCDANNGAHLSKRQCHNVRRNQEGSGRNCEVCDLTQDGDGKENGH